MPTNSSDVTSSQGWRNVASCMCSITVDAKGARIDQSACPVHGKSKAKS